MCWGTKTRHSTPAGVSQVLQDGNDYFLWLAGYTLTHAAKDVTVLFLPQGHGAGSCSNCPLGPPGLLLRVGFYPDASHPLQLHGIIPSQAGLCVCLCWTSWGSCLPISATCQGPSEQQPSPLPYLSISLPSVASSAPMGCPALTKDCKPVSLSIDPWGTSLIAGYQLGFVSLMTTLWAQ